MPKNYSLIQLCGVVAVMAGLFAVTAAAALLGLVMYLSFLVLLLILFAPSSLNLIDRSLIILMGVGAAIVCWCCLRGAFGITNVGQGWYRGQADEIGGWAAGIFVAAWRASVLFLDRHPGPKD